MEELLDSASLLSDPARLRERFTKSGFIFVRGLLEAVAVYEVLENVRQTAVAAGWLATNLAGDRTIRLGLDLTPEDHKNLFVEAFRQETVHALGHHPKLLAVIETLLGNNILVHPRPFIRLIPPVISGDTDRTTETHQDYVSQQGTTETITAWIALHECPRQHGGLAISEESHLRGVLPMRLGAHPGSLEVDDELDGTWRTTDYEAGDVLFFHSLTAHKGLPNHTEALRLSVDVRYQRADEPINPQSLELLGLPYSWDELYANWGDGAPRHYWKSKTLLLLAFNPSYLEERDELAFRLAKECGDRRAIREMHRIATSTRDPMRRARAEAVLASMSEATKGGD